MFDKAKALVVSNSHIFRNVVVDVCFGVVLPEVANGGAAAETKLVITCVALLFLIPESHPQAHLQAAARLDLASHH